MKRLAAISIVCALAVWMLTGIPVLAEEKAADKTERDTAETTTVQPKETTSQDDARKNTGPGWPRPYKPTEEISADSIVPFPTDI